jgi:hypothetical protein
LLIFKNLFDGFKLKAGPAGPVFLFSGDEIADFEQKCPIGWDNSVFEARY